MKVLIVDDKKDICNYLERELRKEGYEVEYTTSPLEVIERLSDAAKGGKPYELILLDLRMPKRDGFELMKDIRDERLDPDVIIITGYGDEDKAIEAIRLGAVDYLRKPISLEELHTAIFRVQQKKTEEAEMAFEHRILVVDDEKELCARLKSELEKEGYRVAVAYDGDEGLEYFKNNRVDLALVDIKMPRMSGLEMLKRCQIITDDFVSVIITGHGDHEAAIEALRLGVFSYLRKPLPLDELLASVNKGIDLLLLRRSLSARQRELEIETALKEQYAKNLEKMVAERTRELRESEKSYRSLYLFNEQILRNSPAGIIRLDKQLRVEYENPEMRKILGVPSGEESKAIGMDVREIPSVKETGVAHIFNDLLEGRKISAEAPFTSIYGREAYLDIKGVPISENAEFAGAVLLINDISAHRRAEEALRESEEQYRLLAENVIDVIWAIDMNLRFTYISPSVTRMRGYSVEEAMSQTLEEILTPASLEVAMKAFAEEMAAEEMEEKDLSRSPTLELENYCKDGSTIWTEVKITGLRDPDGRLVGLLGVTRDISARKRAEESLRQSEIQLRQSQKMEAIGTLAGGVAHDFNNILTAIQGNADLALMNIEKDHPLNKYLDEITKSSTRAANLIRQLLIFSRRQPMEMAPLAINSLIQGLAKMLDRLIGEDIFLHMNLDPKTWAVEGDAGTIEQVIMNLIVNARDAMPEGGEISITSRNVHIDDEYCKTYTYARPGKFVHLSVRDRGMGMDQAVIDRIFEPFFTTKEAGKGTGLGLSVVYGIVKQHKGWINVESSPGSGAIFHVYLPAVSVKVEEKEKEPVSLETLRGSGERILLVEDDKALRETAEKLLSDNGYTTFVAGNVQEAVNLFQKEGCQFDLIFCDVVLPDGTGPKLVDELLKLRPGIGVLFTSGYVGEKSGWSAIKEAGFPYLQKPYSSADLLKAVKNALKKE